VELLAEHPPIDKVDTRRVILGEIKTTNGQWKPLPLFVLPDYHNIQLDRVTSQPGNWPPAINQILIERQTVSVLGGTYDARPTTPTNWRNDSLSDQ